MKRPKAEEGDGFGSDSFLDIVANIVGILIILVTVVGVRVQHAPALSSSPAVATEQVDLAPLQSQVSALQQEIDANQQQLATARDQQQRSKNDADALAARLVDSELSLAQDRDAIMRRAEQVEKLEAEVMARRAANQQLAAKLNETKPPEQQIVKIDSYATPLSRSVDGKEAHFQLLGNRLVYVPMEELLQQMKNDGQHLLREDRTSPMLSATVGPSGGFRLHYTMKRESIGFARLLSFALTPEARNLGEPIEQALDGRSQFRLALSRFDPENVTITVWTYPDSFGAFRALKKELHRLGYAMAGRPLPFGEPIGGSPQGTRSSAQ